MEARVTGWPPGPHPLAQCHMALIASPTLSRSNLRKILSAPRRDGEAVEAEGGAKIGARLRFSLFERDAGRVGDAVDRIEEPDDSGGVDEALGPNRRVQRFARPGEPRLIVAEHGFGKLDEEPAVRNPRVARDAAQHRR